MKKQADAPRGADSVRERSTIAERVKVVVFAEAQLVDEVRGLRHDLRSFQAELLPLLRDLAEALRAGR